MNTSDLQRLIDAALDIGGTGCPVDIPPGSVIDLTDDDGDGVCIKLSKTVWLRGNGSVLNVPKGTVAIDCGTTQWPQIERLTFNGVAPFDVGSVGVDLSHGVRLSHCLFKNLGAAMRAMSTNTDGTARRNVNCPSAEKIVVLWCGSALQCSGADSNQWSLDGVEIGECLIGIDDGGFLGGTAHNILFQDCPPPGQTGMTVRITSETNYSTFVGCYAEDGQTPMQDASQSTLRVGGTFVSQPGGEAIGCGYSHLRFRQPGGRVMVHMPSADLDGVLDWQHDSESAAWYLKREDFGAAGTYYALAWANLGSVQPLTFTAERSDLSQIGVFAIRTA